MMDEHVLGMRVETIDEFLNVDIGNGYILNFRKIGDSIIHSFNSGNLKYTNQDKYYEYLPRFIEQSGAKTPVIEIRDFQNLRGKANSKQLQLQYHYSKKYKHLIGGLVACNISKRLDTLIWTGIKLLKLPIQIEIRPDLNQAIEWACQIPSTPVADEKVELSLKNVQMRPEWSVQRNGYKITNGVIFGKLFYSKMEGKFKADDIPEVFTFFESVFKDGGIAGQNYIRIADYSNFDQISIATKNRFAALTRDIHKKYNAKPTVILICGAKLWIRTTMKLFSSLVNQRFIFLDSVEEAFKAIVEKGFFDIKSDLTVHVSQYDIDEIIKYSGTLIWGDQKRQEIKVSPDNPLKQLTHTISLIRDDLSDLRKKEEDQRKEMELSLIKMELLNRELKERESEYQQLNKQLAKANDLLKEQKEELEQTQNQLTKANTTLEQRVLDRTEKLNKTVQELDRFVYSASHDLSAPLKSILGLVNIARLDPDKEQSQTYLNHIEKSIYNLEDVIKNLITFSRNNRLEVSKESVQIKSLVCEVISELSFLPNANKININFNIPEHLEITTDSRRLKTVLHNLINNSIKYADMDKPTQKIEIECQLSENETRIQITDNGIGIEEEHHDKIFNMFHRATEKSKGSGLGLFIVSETIDVLSGKIEVRSTPKFETSFIISLPRISA